MDVPGSVVQNIIDNIEHIIAVGTTSLRTIESLYWIGVKIATGKPFSAELDQWECYDMKDQDISPDRAFEALATWMKEKNMKRLITKTQIIIAPGYKFRIVKGLITNFHQPQSTLLLLIAAFIGDDWKKVYEYALENNFRFLSYGDGCLLWPNQ